MADPTLIVAARRGDRLGELKALRRTLAASITEAKRAGDWRSVSPLSGKLIEVGREIELLADALRKADAALVPDEPFDPATI